MKILFCTNERIWPLTGGGTVGTLRILQKFVERKHKVVVTCPLYLNAKVKKELENNLGARLVPFSPFIVSRDMKARGPKYIFYSFLFVFHLLNLLKKEKFDVIFVRNSILGFSIRVLRPIIKIPVAISYTDFLSIFLYENPHYPKFVVDFFFNIEKSTAKCFDKIFVVTPKMKKILVDSGVNEKKIVISYDGVDTRLFNPLSISKNKILEIKKEIGFKNKIVIFHGTIEYHHGIGFINEVIKKTLRIDKEINFIIIGGGPAFNELKKIEGKNVKLMGFVPHEKIPPYIAAADVGIIPYRKNLNLDMVLTLKLLEYLAMGKPVVCTDLESVKEIFGRTGFVMISNNSSEFSNNISALIKRRIDSKNIVSLIQKNFSWGVVTEKICREVENLK